MDASSGSVCVHVVAMQDFKGIHAWRRSHAMSIAIHELTRFFPRRGYPRLRAQLTGAADSIPENIVEGCGAASNKDFARFLDMSIKSANETEYHLLKARDLAVISHDVWRRFNVETIEIRKMIYSYRRQVLENERSKGH